MIDQLSRMGAETLTSHICPARLTRQFCVFVLFYYLCITSSHRVLHCRVCAASFYVCTTHCTSFLTIKLKKIGARITEFGTRDDIVTSCSTAVTSNPRGQSQVSRVGMRGAHSDCLSDSVHFIYQLKALGERKPPPRQVLVR